VTGDIYIKQIKDSNKYGVFRTDYPKDKKLYVGSEADCNNFKSKMYDKILAKLVERTA